jgi:hypothetical protein
MACSWAGSLVYLQIVKGATPTSAMMLPMTLA